MFLNALQEYRYLLERGYPERAGLALVGNRHGLSRLERNCLFRGVVKGEVGAGRRAKLVGWKAVRAEPLGVDWYNVLITVESYLKGYPVFLADDGLLRDAAGVHGSYRMGKTSERAITLITKLLGEIGPESLEVFLDSPIAYSGRMASLLRPLLGESGKVEVIRSADYALKRFGGIVASSDSVVIDRAAAVFDLPRAVLEKKLGHHPADMDAFALAQSGG